MQSIDVSVVIPVYNGAAYMREAIDSALNQILPPCEVIVVNDGSDDGGKTREIALSYGDRIRYFEKENGGVSSALNYGIRHMRGDYFSWLSHDDVYTPDKLACEVGALTAAAREKLLISCRASTIDKNSQPVHKKSHSSALPAGEILSGKTVLHHLLRHGTMNGCCFLIPKAAFEECGLFDESLRYAQDTLMWYRIFSAGYELYIAPDTAVKSRVHAAQQTQTARSLYYHDSVSICRRILPVFSAIGTKEESFVLPYALHHAKQGNKDVVRLCREQLKNDGCYSPATALRLRVMLLYGKIRPAIRKWYYRLFRKIKTR